MLTLLLPEQAAADWPRLEKLLSPAIAHDAVREVADVHRDLMAGDMAIFDVSEPGAAGAAVIEFAPSETADRCCWMLYIGGRVGGHGRAWLATVRGLMARFEQIAREHGCEEMRVEGRDWSCVLTDYTATGSNRHELLKRL
jgi:hypothetical protein